MARGSYQNRTVISLVPRRGAFREAREEDDNMTAALRFDIVFACCAFAFVGAILVGLL
jgi:hypothetical protein